MINDSSIKHLVHDLNNIFTRILNSVDLLKRKVANIESVLPLINSIETSTYLASEMIENTFEKESKTKRQKKINLNSIISDITRITKIQQRDKIEFKHFLNLNLKLVVGMYSDFYRLIINLINNSVESIEREGTISIYTRNLNEEEKIEVKIIDTGSGIDEFSLTRIFDENYSTRKKENKSGVGLSIVKKIVETYNGTISVNSHLEEGTEFIITLPSTKNADININTDGKTILIAEDEDILRELLSELLQSYNYTVISSPDGEDVLDQLKIRTPDLLIIDQNMTKMNGLACIDEIKKANIHLPIIFASGSPTEHKDILSNDLITKTINKPYNFDELLTLVRELIG